jgi:hypothetical protein
MLALLLLIPAAAWLIHRSGVLALLRSVPDCNEDFLPY